jgi:hypothetical protein
MELWLLKKLTQQTLPSPELGAERIEAPPAS